jgi:hypothetical protein
MNRESNANRDLQSLAVDEFFYFFLRLRKSEVRRTVQALQSGYPDEPPEDLAKRLIQSKIRLSLLGGALINLPVVFPGAGLALGMIGAVGATSMLTRMHLYLILEIALLFGRDIDDQARVREMIAVIAATGLSVAMPMTMRAVGFSPLVTLPAGALSATLTTRIIGKTAIRYYQRKQQREPSVQPVDSVAA